MKWQIFQITPGDSFLRHSVAHHDIFNKINHFIRCGLLRLCPYKNTLQSVLKFHSKVFNKRHRENLKYVLAKTHETMSKSKVRRRTSASNKGLFARRNCTMWIHLFRVEPTRNEVGAGGRRCSELRTLEPSGIRAWLNEFIKTWFSIFGDNLSYLEESYNSLLFSMELHKSCPAFCCI